MPEGTGEDNASPTSSAQRLLQVQPQLQEPPVVQVQSAPQPQPQGQAGAGGWTGMEGRGRQEQVMGLWKRWVWDRQSDLGGCSPAVMLRSPFRGRVQRRLVRVPVALIGNAAGADTLGPPFFCGGVDGVAAALKTI